MMRSTYTSITWPKRIGIKLSFLPDQKEVRSLAGELESFLEAVNRARLETLSRIDYYSDIRDSLIDGLRLITKVNQAMSASGITSEIIRDRQQLAKENLALKEQIETKLAAGDRKFNVWMLGVTIIIVLSTAIGLLFQSAGTRYLFDERSVIPQPTPEGTVPTSAPRVPEANPLERSPSTHPQPTPAPSLEPTPEPM